MNETLLKQELIRYEGNTNTVYLDSLGNPTVGIGHMDKSLLVGAVLGPSQIDVYYQGDVANALSRAKNAIGNEFYMNLDDVRQRLFVQLAFNLGNKLAAFHNMIAFAHAGNWDRAADELQNSTWYSQVGRRGPESCFCMRAGSYGWE